MASPAHSINLTEDAAQKVIDILHAALFAGGVTPRVPIQPEPRRPTNLIEMRSA